MAFELLLQPSITASSVLPLQITQRGGRIFANNFKSEKSAFRSHFSQFKPVLASNSGSQSCCLISGIKASLYEAVQGINRGIFGVPSAKKAEIEGIVKQLECQNPTPNPTDYLEKADGCWKLVYSTISILGVKRTKLGLRDFVSLGDFLQIIDVDNSKAYNVIKFSVRGLKILTGELSIVASFQIASKSRVYIKYESSTIEPEQLMNIFRKNYDILLGIFNPEGWLEISYVDESMRIGRDDKGNLFILERCA